MSDILKDIDRAAARLSPLIDNGQPAIDSMKDARWQLMYAGAEIAKLRDVIANGRHVVDEKPLQTRMTQMVAELSFHEPFTKTLEPQDCQGERLPEKAMDWLMNFWRSQQPKFKWFMDQNAYQKPKAPLQTFEPIQPYCAGGHALAKPSGSYLQPTEAPVPTYCPGCNGTYLAKFWRRQS